MGQRDPHVSDTQSRDVAWPAANSSTARSSAARSLASCSPHSCTPTSTLGWPGGSPERPHRRAWWLGSGAQWQTRYLWWRCDQASTAMTSTNPSGALWCGSSHGEAAMSSGHVHGGTVAHRAWRWCHRSDETVAEGRYPSSEMVLHL